MPRHLLPGVFASLLALFVMQTAHAEKKIYKWKDSNGVVHFSATPPPADAEGATEVNIAGKSAPADPTAQTDAVVPAPVAPPPPRTAEEMAQQRAEEEARERDRIAQQKIEECQAKREALAAANRRMFGESNEILTPLERSELPKLTQQMENDIRANCQ